MLLCVVLSDCYYGKNSPNNSKHSILASCLADILCYLFFLCYMTYPTLNVSSNDIQHLMLYIFHFSYSQHSMLAEPNVSEIYVRSYGSLLPQININQWRINSDKIQYILWNKSYVWLDSIEFRTRINQFECSKNIKMSIQNERNAFLNENSVEGKACINREGKSNELKI